MIAGAKAFLGPASLMTASRVLALAMLVTSDAYMLVARPRVSPVSSAKMMAEDVCELVRPMKDAVQAQALAIQSADNRAHVIRENEDHPIKRSVFLQTRNSKISFPTVCVFSSVE